MRRGPKRVIGGGGKGALPPSPPPPPPPRCPGGRRRVSPNCVKAVIFLVSFPLLLSHSHSYSAFAAAALPHAPQKSSELKDSQFMTRSLEAWNTVQKNTPAQFPLNFHLLSDLDHNNPRKISISKSPCEVDGQSGTCMFHLKCSTGNGKVLGMCREGFLMGVCCQLGSDEVSGNGDKYSKDEKEGGENQNETSENSVKNR